MDRDFALFRDNDGRTGILHLKPEGEGWRVIALEEGMACRPLTGHVTHSDLSTRLLTREEATLAFREWQAALRLSQSYVVRPFSPIKAWQARWGWRSPVKG